MKKIHRNFNSTFLLLLQICSAMYLVKANGHSETIVAMPRMDLLQTSCRMRSLNVTITRTKCQPQIITNNFCFGVCHSFYIPNDRKVIKVQDACAPTDTIQQRITLTCRKKRKPGMRKKIVTVSKVVACGCERL